MAANHLLLALTVMKLPVAFTADTVQDWKLVCAEWAQRTSRNQILLTDNQHHPQSDSAFPSLAENDSACHLARLSSHPRHGQGYRDVNGARP